MSVYTGFIASLRNDTSFTSRPVEIADSHGEARTLAGALGCLSSCLFKQLPWGLSDQ